MVTNEEKFEFIKKCIRVEHGKLVQDAGTLLIDCELDSFGMFAVLTDIDSEYGIFKSVPDGIDPMVVVNFKTLTIQNIIDGNVVDATLLATALNK